MDRYRLKNIIILILVLVNLFLVGSLAIRETSRRSARRTAAEQLVALFAADGIALDPAAVSGETPPAARTLLRDAELERQAAAALLGNHLSRSDQGGGITTYSSSQGAALFRASGSFDASGTLAKTDAVDFCRAFCKEFRYEEPVFRMDGAGSGTATVTRLYDGFPVFNCTVTFTIENGVLTAVNGTLLPETDAETDPEAQPLSAAAALTAFQQMRRETGAVVSSVTGMDRCFELQSSPAVAMSLVPSWRIVTNTKEYYVNCQTGAVTSS